jgi:malonate transporter
VGLPIPLFDTVAAAVPATRAMAVAFGNSVQLGTPMATALFGEEGLAIHIPLVSLHALILLSVLTALVELDLARPAHGRGMDPHSMRRALATVGKLFVLPAAVLLVARFGFGLTRLTLAVLVMMAAVPVGTNALLCAQRYGVLEAEATAAIVASTFAFVATAGLWLTALSLIS